jgi:hypothetical protein
MNLDFRTGPLLSDFPTAILYACLISVVSYIGNAHSIFLDLNIIIIFFSGYVYDVKFRIAAMFATTDT